jgi:putative peptidoglycan lipid II flippase
MLFKSTSELRLRSVNSKIFAAIITVGTFSIIVKLFSTFQHLVMAYRFGTSDALDAFLIAFSIPSLAINIVTGSLNAAFMPTYIQVLDHDGKDSAFQLFSNMTIVSSLLVLFLITILVFIIPHVLPIL